MNILELIPTLKSGGAEKFVVELSNEMIKTSGVNVHVLQLRPITDKDICAKHLQNKISRKSLDKGSGFSIKAMICVYKYIRANKISHVHAHTSAISYILLSALLCKKVKFFATIHSDAAVDASGGFVISTIRKFLFKSKICTPVTISDESYLSFKNYYKIDAPLIYNGVSSTNNINRINNSYNDKELNFVHVARVNTLKNQVVLYKAFQKLLDEGYKINLYHYGRFFDDNISSELKELCNDRIKIMGEIDDARNVLYHADAMCLSSIMEGMPMTIIEAFSVGCPVICTPVGGCVNMVSDMVNGILAKDITIDGYYDALKKFVSLDSETRNELKTNAKLSFEKYNIKNTALSYFNLFSK